MGPKAAADRHLPLCLFALSYRSPVDISAWELWELSSKPEELAYLLFSLPVYF